MESGFEPEVLSNDAACEWGDFHSLRALLSPVALYDRTGLLLFVVGDRLRPDISQ